MGKGKRVVNDHHYENEGFIAMESMAMAVLSTSSLPLGTHNVRPTRNEN